MLAQRGESLNLSLAFFITMLVEKRVGSYVFKPAELPLLEGLT